MVARPRNVLVVLVLGALVGLGTWAVHVSSGSRQPSDVPTAGDRVHAGPAQSTLELEPAWISEALPSQRVVADRGTPAASQALVADGPRPTRLVRGVVFEGEDEPVTAGTLKVQVESRPPRTLQAIELEPDGRFELRMPVGAQVSLRAELPHGPVGMRQLITYGSELPLDVAIHAYQRGSIAGRLVDRKGNGLSGFRVEATQDSMARHSTEVREIRPTAVTDRDGGFELEDLRLAATTLAALGPQGSQEVRWPLAEGLDPASAPSEDYTLPLVQLSVAARGPRSDALALQPARSNWAPLGVSALTYEPVEDGWIGPSAKAEVRERGTAPRPGDPALLAVETGHTYRLTLTGADHETLVQDVDVPDADANIEVNLRPARAGPLAAVELALEDPRGIVGEQFRWNLSALRNDMHHPVKLPEPGSAVTQPELPPARYSLGIRFLASERASSDPEGHGSSTSQELRDEFWSVNDTIEVVDPTVVPGVQRFLLDAEHALPPFPPGLVGPGDY